MVSLNNFNAEEVEPSLDFEAIPAGKYLAIITESETKPTKAGTGTYLELTFQVIEGEYKNRLLWARLNLENPNPTTVEIARSELSSICRAVGVMKPQDSVEIHDIPLLITVKCKKREDTGELANEIRGYQKRSENLAQVNQAVNQTPPWKRN